VPREGETSQDGLLLLLQLLLVVVVSTSVASTTFPTFAAQYTFTGQRFDP